MTRVSDGPRRRRMIRGTIARTGELAMRYGLSSQLATLDCTSSRRSTVMCALPWATAVTTVYQRDSSSKRPRSSVVSAVRAPTRRRSHEPDTACRVAGGSCPPPALTEPDLWASHPALRDVGVGGNQSASAAVGIAARSYSSASVSCAGAMTRWSSPAGCLRAWFSTSAPHTGQRVRVGPSLCRERPLAGCRLSRETNPVGLRVRWPWSPSLPAWCARMGPPFDGLPVLRDHPTPLVSSPSRRWFLDGYRLSAEAERSPRVSTQNFVPTPSPIRPPARRIWASLPWASSPAGVDASAALRFRSVRYCIIRLLPDAPSRAALTRRPCLVDGGFPPSGPQEDLTYCMSHLVVLCSCRAHPGLRALRAAPSAPLDPAPGS